MTCTSFVCTYRFALMLVVLAERAPVEPAGLAQETPPPRSERREYDPRTGGWVEVAAPVPGTEGGDLEIARGLLARNQFNEGRAALKKWRKAYPESGRWPEGLFYSADVEVAAVEHREDGDLMRAYRWYEEILDNWAGTDWAERALRRELIVAEMFLFKGKKQYVWRGLLKLPATDEALSILDRLIGERAAGTGVAEQALRIKADYLYQAGRFDEAEGAYAQLARDFPRGRYERLALLRSADAAFASFPGVKFDDSALLNADERYRKYAQQFPDAAAAEDVPARLERIRESRAEKEYLIGLYYERTDSRNAAIYYYRFVADSWPDTAAAAEARARLTALGSDAQPASGPAAELPASGP